MNIAEKVRKSPTPLLIVGCAMIFAATVLTFFSIYSARSNVVAPVRSNEQARAATKVLAAARAIGRGVEITQEDLGTIEIVGKAPAGSFTNSAEIVGRVAVLPISQSQIFLADSLSKEKSSAGVSALLQKGARAISVRISDDQIAGGFLRVGDHVDVFATLPDSLFEKGGENTRDRAGDQSQTTLLLQNVAVLAVGTKLQTEGAEALKGVQTVTLEVSPKSVAQIALVERLGKLKFAIRNPSDELVAPATMASLSDLESGASGLPHLEDESLATTHASGRGITIYSGATVSTVNVAR